MVDGTKNPWETPAATARKITRKLTEGKIQKACVDYARSKGWWARKFSSPSQRSVPDYLFAKIWPHEYVKIAVEFKAPGKKSSDAQLEEQRKMREAGWEVWEDIGTNGELDITKFKQALDALNDI